MRILLIKSRLDLIFGRFVSAIFKVSILFVFAVSQIRKFHTKVTGILNHTASSEKYLQITGKSYSSTQLKISGWTKVLHNFC